MEYRTVSLMAIILCNIFALRVAVPVPLPAKNPYRASWNWMEDNIRRLVILDIAFHGTSTSPIPLKSLPPPLGIITTVCQAHNAECYPTLKDACMMVMTFSQFPGSGYSSHFTVKSHILKCSALMPVGPPTRCSRSRRIS